jgi:hypothetical protein
MPQFWALQRVVRLHQLGLLLHPVMPGVAGRIEVAIGIGGVFVGVGERVPMVEEELD